MQSDIRLNFSLNIRTDMTEVADIRLIQGDAQKFPSWETSQGGHRAREGGVNGRPRRCCNTSISYKV